VGGDHCRVGLVVVVGEIVQRPVDAADDAGAVRLAEPRPLVRQQDAGDAGAGSSRGRKMPSTPSAVQQSPAAVRSTRRPRLLLTIIVFFGSGEARPIFLAIE
jgi:hypothetical protein